MKSCFPAPAPGETRLREEQTIARRDRSRVAGDQAEPTRRWVNVVGRADPEEVRAQRISPIADSMAEREGFELSVLVSELRDDVNL